MDDKLFKDLLSSVKEAGTMVDKKSCGVAVKRVIIWVYSNLKR